MTRFNVRIELFGEPDADVYDELHEKMQDAKYYRDITGDTGITYHLPRAEYVATADWTCNEIREEVWGIAKSVWGRPSVYVTVAGDRC